MGPWPGTNAVSSPIGQSFVVIERISCCWSPRGKSQRPTEPLNSTSPTSARFERPANDAVLRPVLAQLLDPEAVVLVRAFDRNAKLLGENAGTAAMVDVAVGQQDFLDRDARLRGRRLEPRQVAARVDERAAHRRGAPQQGAILLQRRHRDYRGLERRLCFAHFQGSVADRGSSVAVAGGSPFIEAATASACRSTRSRLPPASFDRSSSLQPRRISSANSNG
jgi:hypothetical protein